MKIFDPIFKLSLITSFIICSYFPIVHAQNNSNTLTFDNKSEEFALVKLIGPTGQTIEVPNGETRTVNVSEGEYYIFVRYGNIQNQYTYSKGDPFTVKETSTQYSAITITLHKVIDGNYSTHPATKKEFEKTSDLPAPSTNGQISKPQAKSKDTKNNDSNTQENKSLSNTNNLFLNQSAVSSDNVQMLKDLEIKVLGASDYEWGRTPLTVKNTFESAGTQLKGWGVGVEIKNNCDSSINTVFSTNDIHLIDKNGGSHNISMDKIRDFMVRLKTLGWQRKNKTGELKMKNTWEEFKINGEDRKGIGKTVMDDNERTIIKHIFSTDRHLLQVFENNETKPFAVITDFLEERLGIELMSRRTLDLVLIFDAPSDIKPKDLQWVGLKPFKLENTSYIDMFLDK